MSPENREDAVKNKRAKVRELIDQMVKDMNDWPFAYRNDIKKEYTRKIQDLFEVEE